MKLTPSFDQELFKIGPTCSHYSENMEVVFHIVGRPYDVPSDFVIAVLCALPISILKFSFTHRPTSN
jgi:hypothetical protein